MMKVLSKLKYSFQAAALTAAVMVAFGGGTGAAFAQGQIRIDDRVMMNLIGQYEGPEGYDAITLRTRLRPFAPISELTINQVIDFQGRVIASGASASAMGKYQFIRMTLVEVIGKHRVNGKRPFDKTTQDYLARMMLNSCGFYDLDRDKASIANCMARVWAALPMATGPRAGKSYYKTNGNKSLTSVASVYAALDARTEGRISTRNPQPKAPKAEVTNDGTIVIRIGQ